MGPTQLAEVLRHLPKQANPNLLVGFDTRDDGGVYQVTEDFALVQTLDFFTPVVDDPYWYGAIAAANALSDVYAMGGEPLTVMNIACFDPSIAPPTTWADVLKGAYDKTIESGAVIVGGHSVEDKEPKFGLSVTGRVHPDRVFSNALAKIGDEIFLSKPLGVGIATTAAKQDACPAEILQQAVEVMVTLNKEASQIGQAAGVRCATDITGFGLAGHLYNIAKASDVTIELDWQSLPLLEGILELAQQGYTTGGAEKNRAFLGSNLTFAESVPAAIQAVVLDPQTSGGLALFSHQAIQEYPRIGRVVDGPPQIVVR